MKPYLGKAGHGEFPWPLFSKLGELGLAAIPFPTEYGGGGLDYSSYALVLEEFTRLESHLGGVLAVHGLPQLIINHFGTDAQKQKYLPAMARAELLGAFALTEPHAGSDAANINTRAELRGDNYILSGQKIWITHGGEADVYLVMAVTEKGKGAKGISSFIVEKGAPGLAFGKRERPMGLPHHTREVFFEDCEIPRENLVGSEGDGFKVAMTALDSGRITVAATSIGTAQAAFDHALKYSTERRAFGQAISEFQGIQFMLADMAAAIEAARCVMRKAAYLRDRQSALQRDCFDGETAGDRCGDESDYGCCSDLWRLRHQRRLSRSGVDARSQDRADRRRHEPDSTNDHRPRVAEEVQTVIQSDPRS